MSSAKAPAAGAVVRYACQRVAAPIHVDGHLGKDAWSQAPRSPRFVDMTTGAPTLFEPRAAML